MVLNEDFLNMYEELSTLNESLSLSESLKSFKEDIIPEFNKLQPKFGEAEEILNNSKYIKIYEKLQSCIKGLKICYNVQKQIESFGEPLISIPYTEATHILTTIKSIIFYLVDNSDNKKRNYRDHYLKYNKLDAWTDIDLKYKLKKAGSQLRNFSINTLDFSEAELI